MICGNLKFGKKFQHENFHSEIFLLYLKKDSEKGSGKGFGQYSVKWSAKGSGKGWAGFKQRFDAGFRHGFHQGFGQGFGQNLGLRCKGCQGYKRFFCEFQGFGHLHPGAPHHSNITHYA